jgi:uncharacterized protein YjbI with pentapeptide repeats
VLNFVNKEFEEDASFVRATFENANFYETTFQKYADFRRATFENANFEGATFENVEFVDTTSVSVESGYACFYLHIMWR